MCLIKTIIFIIHPFQDSHNNFFSLMLKHVNGRLFLKYNVETEMTEISEIFKVYLMKNVKHAHIFVVKNT